MIKSKIRVAIQFFLLVIVFLSCDSENTEPSIEINFDLSDAQAIVLQEANFSSSENANLFKVDSDGNVNAVIDSVTVIFARTFSQGVYLEIRELESSAIRKFYVLMDNSFVEIEDLMEGIYVGENENGDLIFSDASILRANTITVDNLQTTLDFPSVQSISGNLAIITDNSIFQIFNTVTNTRYNINGCNGPRIEAFNGSLKAIVDDCSNEILFDMSDGSRTAVTAISSWNNESLRVSDGIVILSEGIAEVGDFRKYALAHVDPEGNFTTLTDNEFQPGSFPCMNCGFPNTVLFGTDQYLVIRELNKISVVDRNNNNSISSILDGFNVTKVSLEGHLVYYLAEDNIGNPTVGVYDILNSENQILDNQTIYTDIQTF